MEQHLSPSQPKSLPSAPALLLAPQSLMIVEQMSDAFYSVDDTWRLTYLNHQAEQLWNRPRTDLPKQVSTWPVP